MTLRSHVSELLLESVGTDAVDDVRPSSDAKESKLEAHTVCAAANGLPGPMDLDGGRAPGAVPMAFLFGREIFMGYEFACERNVLVPRAVTSTAVQAALRLIATLAEPIVVDVCCGSGNMGCTVALEHQGSRVWCADLMPAPVALAKKNVEALGLAGRVEVRAGDLFAALAEDGLAGRVHAILSSPPFISTSRLEHESAYLLEHEPREAFDAGPYGLSIHQRLVREALPWLAPGGYLVCECGEGQAKQVRILFERTHAYDQIEVAEDSAGIARAVSGRKRS